MRDAGDPDGKGLFVLLQNTTTIRFWSWLGKTAPSRTDGSRAISAAASARPSGLAGRYFHAGPSASASRRVAQGQTFRPLQGYFARATSRSTEEIGGSGRRQSRGFAWATRSLFHFSRSSRHLCCKQVCSLGPFWLHPLLLTSKMSATISRARFLAVLRRLCQSILSWPAQHPLGIKSSLIGSFAAVLARQQVHSRTRDVLRLGLHQ